MIFIDSIQNRSVIVFFKLWLSGKTPISQTGLRRNKVCVSGHIGLPHEPFIS